MTSSYLNQPIRTEAEVLAARGGVMHTNAHERAEWARMAAALSNAGHREQAARFAKAAATPHNDGMPSTEFHALQDDYRAWLCFNTIPGGK